MEFNLKYVAVFPRICSVFCEACAMCTGETVDQSNCVQLPRDIMCLPIGSMLLRSKILWMKHVVFWREPDGVIPRATGDWLTGRWDSRKVLRHCHNTWKTSTYARRCWSSRFWHSDWKQDCFLQKEARVCVSNAFVIEDSKFKWCFLLWKMSKWQRKQIC